LPHLLIRDGAVLTPDGWLEPGYVLVSGETIEAVGAGDPPPDVAAGAETILTARHRAILPGLVNGHTHLSQTFMRGLAAGRPLLAWLSDVIWPLQQAMTADELHLAALLGLVENLRAGATTVVDHHKVTTTPGHTEAVCRAAQAVGLNLVLARSWADRGKNAEPADSILADLERLLDGWQGSPLIQVGNGPLVPWRCSAEMLRRTHALAGRYAAPTHLHVSETDGEVQMTLDETGQRPVAWLDSMGVLGPDTHVVHAVWLDDDEIATLAARGAQVVHCPVSNAVLGSGIAPLAAMQRAGVHLRLGSDGPASNDTQDLFDGMKAALSLARASSRDALCITPQQVLGMATDGRSLQPGAPADVIVVNLNTAHSAPVHDLSSALVLSAHGSDVETVLVRGRILMQDRRVTVLDEAALLDACRAAAHNLRLRAGVATG
jgi:5-methylthioadenosine/S-adenosylhomocysteine deaminase